MYMSSRKSVKRIGALSAEKFKHSYTVGERMKQAASMAYESTVGELTHGRVPLVDPAIKYAKEKFDIKFRGKTREQIRKNRKIDGEKINNFFRFTKRKVGGKRANKTRKNLSRKNRK